MIDDNSYTLDPGLQPYPGSTPIPITPMDLWSKRSPNGRPLLVEPWSFCNFIVHQRPWWDGGGMHPYALDPGRQPYPGSTPIPITHMDLWSKRLPNGRPLLVEPWSFCNFIVHQRPWWHGGGGIHPYTLDPGLQPYSGSTPILITPMDLWSKQYQNGLSLSYQFSYKNDNNSPPTQPIFFDDGSLDAPKRALSNGDKKKSIGCAVEKIWIFYCTRCVIFNVIIQLWNFSVTDWYVVPAPPATQIHYGPSSIKRRRAHSDITYGYWDIP